MTFSGAGRTASRNSILDVTARGGIEGLPVHPSIAGARVHAASAAIANDAISAIACGRSCAVRSRSRLIFVV
jgi:hypothetical protein